MRSQRRQVLVVGICVVLLATPTYSADRQWPAPEWAVEAFKKAGVDLAATSQSRFVVATHVNPLILFGDFDGDHETDAALLVRETRSSKVGIVVTLQSGRTDVLGAGTPLSNGGDNFDWLDHWYTYTKGAVGRGVDGTDLPTLIGDALFVEKSESASAIIYFTGFGYSWHQQGD